MNGKNQFKSKTVDLVPIGTKTARYSYSSATHGNELSDHNCIYLLVFCVFVRLNITACINVPSGKQFTAYNHIIKLIDTSNSNKSVFATNVLYCNECVFSIIQNMDMSYNNFILTTPYE